MKERLFTPGPVEIPQRVLDAMARRPPHHRSRVFRTLLADLHPRLDRLFGTSGRVVVLSTSGTGGMDAAVAAVARSDQPMLVASAGKFGERWEKILRAYGHRPHVVSREWGEAIPAEALTRAFEQSGARVVFLTHSETSTGTLHDLAALSAVARRHDALVVADVITSLGVHEFRQDDFGVDIAIAGSQKGLMLSPGLSLVGLGRRVLERLESDGPAQPGFYLDLGRAADSAAKGDTPFTPAVSLILALDEAVRMIEELTLAALWQRHEATASAMRAGSRAAGFRLLSERPANSVTALLPPGNIDAGAVVERLRVEHGLTLAGGQDHLEGKIVRIGHMGLAYQPVDAFVVCEALEECVCHLGSVVEPGAVRAAIDSSIRETPCESSSPTR